MPQTDPKYNALFTPWKIRDVEIKNRIVLCPMGGTSLFGWFELTGCKFDREAAKFFLERAQNNVGLIIPGIAPLRDTFWGKWLWQNEKMFDDLRVFMEEIHKTGAKLFIQLTAGMGRSWAITELVGPLHKNKFTRALVKPIIDTSHELACPSPQPARWAPDIECPEMTVEQIHEIIEAFAKTAKLCRDAGVDGVEVHAVHEGYLLDQFSIEFFNKRTDEYGGSFENRYRFAVEVVKAIKEACGEDFPVSLRYSVESKLKGFAEGAVPGEEYTEVGRNMEESERAAKYLQDAGYDMLNADNGTYDSWYWAHPPHVYAPELQPRGCCPHQAVCGHSRGLRRPHGARGGRTGHRRRQNRCHGRGPSVLSRPCMDHQAHRRSHRGHQALYLLPRRLLQLLLLQGALQHPGSHRHHGSGPLCHQRRDHAE